MSKATDEIFERIETFVNPGHGLTPEDYEGPGSRKYHEAQADNETFRRVEKMITELADICNSSGEDIIQAAVVNGLNRQHRYLQNKLIVSLLMGLGDLGLLYKEEPARFSDARNDFAMATLQTFRERFHDALFWRDSVQKDV